MSALTPEQWQHFYLVALVFISGIGHGLAIGYKLGHRAGKLAHNRGRWTR